MALKRQSRTNFDLTAHQNTSGKDMTYFDQELSKSKFFDTYK